MERRDDSVELLRDGFDRGAPPISVQAGMIRQLLVRQGRDRSAAAMGRPLWSSATRR
jgi:hypothetical protein